jgi:hypothetical protein
MGQNWAIAIGINSYRNLQRLNYAKQDAKIFPPVNFLVRRSRCG